MLFQATNHRTDRERPQGGFVCVSAVLVLTSFWAVLGVSGLVGAIRETPPDHLPTLARSTRSTEPVAVSAAELRALQREHRGAIGACYQRAARYGLNVPPKIDVTVRLAAAGAIDKVTVDARAGTVVGGCLQRVVQRFGFSSDLTAQTLSFPIIVAR